ncbi:MAG: MBL fold metallo-hydrolase [Dehalococcoidia bacterium]|nr:MBL fold metallo-hydrolase [Dehalococcoidia bacterium]
MPLLIRRLPVGPYQANSYLVACLRTLDAVLLDPGDEAQRLLEASAGFNVRYLIVTHGHPDHIGALAEVKASLGAPVAYHPADRSVISVAPDLELADGMDLPLGDHALRVLHLPGHTPGSIGVLTGADLFAGDTLFPGGPGRTNTPEDLVELAHTIKERLFTLAGETTVYPGHGVETTIGREMEASRAFLARVEAGWRGSGDLTWEST